MPDILVSVKAIIKNRDKFLILKQTRPDTYYWDLPGGKIQYGESPEETLKREVKEETTLEVALDKVLGMWWFFSPTQKHQVICLTYVCNVNNPKVDIFKNPDNTRIRDYAWVTKEEFLSGKYKILHASLIKIVNEF